MKNRNRAFTLIEILIASAIFSVVALSIYSAFQAGILSYRKIDSSSEIFQSARISLAKIELDLKNSFAYLASDNKAQFSGNTDSMEFLTAADYYKDASSNPAIFRVKYSWNDSSKSLTRSYAMGLNALKADMAEEPAVLAGNVRNLSFEYAYKNNNALIWQQSWPSQDDPGLTSQQEKVIPLAVRIKLSLEKNSADAAEETVDFIKIVPLEE